MIVYIQLSFELPGIVCSTGQKLQLSWMKTWSSLLTLQNCKLARWSQRQPQICTEGTPCHPGPHYKFQQLFCLVYLPSLEVSRVGETKETTGRSVSCPCQNFPVSSTLSAYKVDNSWWWIPVPLLWCAKCVSRDEFQLQAPCGKRSLPVPHSQLHTSKKTYCASSQVLSNPPGVL